MERLPQTLLLRSRPAVTILIDGAATGGSDPQYDGNCADVLEWHEGYGNKTNGRRQKSGIVVWLETTLLGGARTRTTPANIAVSMSNK